MTVQGRILKYIEMCQAEGLSLQKGMNYCPQSGRSILLMSLRNNAPYEDRVEDGGLTLIYEGHDASRGTVADPKSADQPGYLPSGRPTENGKFLDAALKYKSKKCAARFVRVYEKLRDGIWADNGLFELVDAWQECKSSTASVRYLNSN